MNDIFSFTLESPLTKEQINLITDAEFEHTDRIWFDTPKGKHIEFVKAPQWIPCSERMPDENNWLGGSRRKFSDEVLVSVVNYDDDEILTHISQTIEGKWALNFASRCKVIAWMPLPKPYEEGMEADGTD